MGFHTLTVSAAAECTGKSNFTLSRLSRPASPCRASSSGATVEATVEATCAKIENHRVVCETVLRYLTRQHLFEHRTRHVVLKERRDELLQSLTSTMGSRLLSTAFSQHGEVREEIMAVTGCCNTAACTSAGCNIGGTPFKTEIEVKDEIRLKFESNEKKDEKVV